MALGTILSFYLWVFFFQKITQKFCVYDVISWLICIFQKLEDSKQNFASHTDYLIMF